MHSAQSGSLCSFTFIPTIASLDDTTCQCCCHYCYTLPDWEPRDLPHCPTSTSSSGAMCCIPSPRLHIASDHGFFLMSSRSFIAFRPLNGTQRLTRPLRVSCYNRSSPHEEATPKKRNAGIAFALKKMKSAQTITHSSMLFSLNCTENCILFIYPI